MRASVVASMGLLVASLATLVWIARTAGDTARPADTAPFGAILDRAAGAAGGQNVLAIAAKPGSAPVARIFGTGRAPEGRLAYTATFDPADPLVPALQTLADVAAADFLRDRKLDEATLRTLSLFGVSIVAATDGTGPILPDVGERDPAASPAPEVPGLRISQAQPAFQFLAEEPTIAPDDPLGFRRSVRIGSALFGSTDDDHAPCSYALTIEAADDGEFLLGRGVSGARVTVDGAPATVRTARVPVMLVKVPKGSHRVVIESGEKHALREWIAIAAAAGAVGSLLAMWLLLRPAPRSS